MDFRLRLARAEELQHLLELEELAGQLYAHAGLPSDLPGLELAALHRGYQAQLLWVLGAEQSPPVAFALAQRYPQTLHLRELDVHPHYARRGLGRRLIEHLSERAADLELGAVTLTTYRDVPWNGPYYRRCGFTELAPADYPDWMTEIRQAEVAAGLDLQPRIAMQRAVGESRERC